MNIRGLLSGREMLTFLAVFLAAAGALRLGQGVGAAMALQAAPSENAESPTPVSCPAPPIALANALKERDTQVKAREIALEDRKAALDLAEKALTARLEQVVAAEARLRETLTIADGAAEQDLSRLTAVYEAMKPADAAALFETMSPEFAAGFLGRMRPEAAAAVISGMKPETGYSVSVLIAGRNATAPKE